MSKPRNVDYFAVPDPGDPERMTYWYRNKRGELKPHPAKARYGPRLTWADIAEAGIDRRDRSTVDQFVRNWHRTVSRPWHAAVREAIEQDPITAGLRFAQFAFRCCSCGRLLTDPSSKTYGIGPECRQGMPAEILARLNETVGRVHAASKPQLGVLGGGAVDLGEED
mgnify:CR=1 FL=1